MVLIDHDQSIYHGRPSTDCVQRGSLISRHRFRGDLDHSADRCCYPSLALPIHVESWILGKVASSTRLQIQGLGANTLSDR